MNFTLPDYGSLKLNGVAIDNKRTELGLSKNRFCCLTYIDFKQYQRIKEGTLSRVDLDVLARIITVLNIQSIDELFIYTPPQK